MDVMIRQLQESSPEFKDICDAIDGMSDHSDTEDLTLVPAKDGDQHAGVPLDKLLAQVQQRLQSTLDDIQVSLGDEADAHFELDDILLGLQHWSDDIIVGKDNALKLNENDMDGFGIVASQLRSQFSSMLSAVSQFRRDGFKILQKTHPRYQLSPLFELKQEVEGLQGLVRPLRSFLEAEKGVGSAAIIREAANRATKSIKTTAGSAGTISPETISGPSARTGAAKRRRPPPVAKPRAGKDLADRIHDECFKMSKFDKADFAIAGSVEDLITSEAVRNEMANTKHQYSEEENPYKDDLIEHVAKRCQKLFAICVLIGLRGYHAYLAMSIFMEHDVHDGDLPILHNEELRLQNSGSRNESKLTEIDPDPEVDPDALEPEVWSLAKRTDFYHKQWSFVAQVFSTAKDNYDFPSKAILPFTDSDDTTKRRGGFGEVCKVSIHKKHIQDEKDLLQGLPEYYALKKLMPTTEDHNKLVAGWLKELNNLRAVAKLRNPHIIRFITAFRRGEDPQWDHYLLCEWADSGSLRDLWQKNPKPKLSPSLVLEVTTQLVGLSTAIYDAHYVTTNSDHEGILHGDLKPENILCFSAPGKDLGTWKICDWGLANVKQGATVLEEERTRNPHASVRYEPPECFTGVLVKGKSEPLLKRSRLHDVWTMGCIIFETIIWLAYGYYKLKDFYQDIGLRPDEDRYFVQAQASLLDVKATPKIKKVVETWFDRLEQEPTCQKGRVLGDLLALVRHSLLVVALPPELAQLGDDDDPKLLGIKRRNTIDPQASPKDFLPAQPMAGTGATPAAPNALDPGEGADLAQQAEAIVFNLPEDDLGPNPASSTFLDAVKQEKPKLSQQSKEPVRFKATQLRKALEEIHNRLQGDSSYWSGPVPQPVEVEVPPSSPGLPVFSISSPGETTVSLDTGRSVFDDAFSTAGDWQNTDTTYVDSGGSVPARDDLVDDPAKANLLAVHRPKTIDYAHPPLDHEWMTYVDNKFARRFAQLKSSNTSSIRAVHNPTNLCTTCQGLRVWELAFQVDLALADLKEKTPRCALCALFLSTCEARKIAGHRSVRICRVESWLELNSQKPPALFISCDPDAMEQPPDIQVGSPVLPEVGSKVHFEMMQQWLQDCDRNHNHRVTGDFTGGRSLPTRLIDVGNDSDKVVRLWETNAGDSAEYMALSHPWGKPPHFCTFRTNLAEHKRGIDLERLPATFRDAVIATRALGLRYLWIDSICIIQGRDGDFNAEAKRMENVFSSAYCVLAASCSTHQSDGFLKPRQDRQYVSVSDTRGRQPQRYFICENIDNFNDHVLEGNLNTRGWVLQEHALARRTIFFTEQQTYWECGDGVRCETGTKMRNSLAAFVGDTNFPQMIMSARQGERILRYQDLYKRYSRLGLTRDYDRPYAIDGLQSRLLKAFDTEGGFGIFDEGPEPRRGHLRRSLLWCRGDGVSRMDRIAFSTAGTGKETGTGTGTGVVDTALPPSWSWMAYQGGIDYLELPFDEVRWRDIRSPWMRQSWRGAMTSSPMPRLAGGRIVALGGAAQDFDLGRAGDVPVRMVFDRPEDEGLARLKCLVLGVREEAVPWGSRTNYVLILAPGPAVEGEEERLGVGKTWVRVGAGHLPQRCIFAAKTEVVVC